MARFKWPTWHIPGLFRDVAADEVASRGKPAESDVIRRLADLLRMDQQSREAAALPIPEPDERVKSRFLLLVLGTAGIVVITMGLREVASIVAPVFLALNFVIVAYPFQAWLVRKGVPRALAAFVVCIAIFASLVAFFWSMVWALTLLVDRLPAYGGKFNDMYQLALRNLSRAGWSEERLYAEAKKVDFNRITEWLTLILDSLQGTATLIGLMVTAVLFLLMDTVGIERRARIASKYHPSLFLAMDSFTRVVRKYWMVSTVFGLIIALLDVAALWMLGVPLIFVWGLLSFVTNYIPNVGFVIGLIPPALLALLEGGPVRAILVIVAYWVLNFVVQSLIQPKVAGDAIGVTATVSFVSLIFWSYVLGFAGALVALPATLLVKAILVDGDPGARWINILIASDPSTAVPATGELDPPGDEPGEDPTEGDAVDQVMDAALGEGDAPEATEGASPA